MSKNRENSTSNMDYHAFTKKVFLKDSKNQPPTNSTVFSNPVAGGSVILLF